MRQASRALQRSPAFWVTICFKAGFMCASPLTLGVTARSVAGFMRQFPRALQRNRTALVEGRDALKNSWPPAGCPGSVGRHRRSVAAGVTRLTAPNAPAGSARTGPPGSDAFHRHFWFGPRNVPPQNASLAAVRVGFPGSFAPSPAVFGLYIA